MATHCISFQYFTCNKPCISITKPISLFSKSHFKSPQEVPFSIKINGLKLSNPRLNKKVFASENKVLESGTDDDFKLTYLELDDLPEINCLLITQSLDDHCHLKTLKPLSQKMPNLRLISTPNAKPLLDPLFNNITYLEPGQESEIQVSNGSSVKVRATAGPVLGPPWQRPENGYLVTSPGGSSTLYYEPHCVYDESFLEKRRADVVITPVVKQLLPYFTLVSGQEDAVRLAKLLNAKFIVPMRNGDLDSKGLLSSLVRGEGTMESFKELLLKEVPDAEVLEPTPGVALDISATTNSL